MSELDLSQTVKRVLDRLRNEKKIEMGILLGLTDLPLHDGIPPWLKDFDYLVIVARRKARIFVMRTRNPQATGSSSAENQNKVHHELRKALAGLNTDLNQTSTELALERFTEKVESVFF